LDFNFSVAKKQINLYMATAYETMIPDDHMHTANYSQAAGFPFILIYTFDPTERNRDESEFLQS
jgi:hypothetical protein